MIESIFLMLVVILRLIVSFITLLVIYYYEGVGEGLDIYLASLGVPLVLSSISIAIVQGVWLPKFSGAFKTDRFRSVVGNSLFKVALGYGFVSLLLFYSSGYWGYYLIGEKQSFFLDSFTYYLALAFLASYFDVLSSIYIFVSRIKSKNMEIELFLLVVVSIYFILALYLMPLYGLGLLVLIGVFKGFFLMCYFYYMADERFEIKGSLNIREDYLLSKPIAIASGAYKLNPIVDRVYCAGVGSGSLSVFMLAFNLMSNINVLLERAILAPKYSKFGYYVKNKSKEYLVGLYLRMVGFLVGLSFIVFVILVLIYSYDLSLVVGAGIDVSFAKKIIMLLVYMSGMPLLLIGTITASLFYAHGMIVPPMKVAFFSFCLMLLIKYAFFTLQGGVEGLALSISIYSIISSFLFVLLFYRVYFKNDKIRF